MQFTICKLQHVEPLDQETAYVNLLSEVLKLGLSEDVCCLAGIGCLENALPNQRNGIMIH